MNEIMTRMKSESPSFFKKLTKWMIGIGGTGAAIVALPMTVPQIVIPAAIITVAYHMIVVGAVGSAISKLTVSDPAVLNQPNDTSGKVQ